MQAGTDQKEEWRSSIKHIEQITASIDNPEIAVFLDTVARLMVRGIVAEIKRQAVVTATTGCAGRC